MNNTFTQLKKRKDSLDKLKEEVAKNKVTFQKDERLWAPTKDKVGNGSAVIRFLPAPSGEEVPWVRIWEHGFKGPGGWYIENSLTTIGKDDPVSKYNTQLWNTEVKANQDIARNQKRRLKYISNVYVVKDPGNSDNEGKVFLYRYGKRIFDKLNDAMFPEFDDETAFDPFDLWTGANFRLKVKKGDGGWPNYDKSELDQPKALKKDDEELEEIWNKEYSLQEFLDPSNFKTYEELETKLNRVLGNVAGGPPITEQEEIPYSPTTTQPEPSPTVDSNPFDSDDTTDDDTMGFFEKLGQEDDESDD
tara:strand:+ start:707 stop:1618 length:912 start_codon:yes stop_codon:yes gene_type:complete